MRLSASLLSMILAPLCMAANINVGVGASNSFAFSPSTVFAQPGDTITFTFISRNHSATTTFFENPCPPPDGGVPGGFDTGFLSAIGGETPTSVVSITSSEPQWVACAQAAGAHCRMGMILAINPTAEQTFDQFLANAMSS